MANYKAQATAQFLAQDLQNRTGLTSSADLSGTDPVVTVGAWASTGDVSFKIKVLDQRNGYAAYSGATGAGFTDIVGNAQPVYTGTIFQIIYEKAAATEWPAFTTQTALLNVISDISRRGGRVELYNSAQGAAPNATTNFFRGAFEPNLNWSIAGRV